MQAIVPLCIGILMDFSVCVLCCYVIHGEGLNILARAEKSEVGREIKGAATSSSLPFHRMSHFRTITSLLCPLPRGPSREMPIVLYLGVSLVELSVLTSSVCRVHGGTGHRVQQVSVYIDADENQLVDTSL